MICSSGSDFAVHSDVAGMETTDIRNIGENCAREVVNNTGDEDQTTNCSRTVMDVSEKQHSTTIEKMDSFADRSHQTVVEAGSTGVPCAMSAEEMQLVNHYLNEPMVIREASDHALPQTLILADSVVRPQTPDAALLTVIDVLMSELGYQRTAVCASKLLRCRTAYTLVVLTTFQLSIFCHFLDLVSYFLKVADFYYLNTHMYCICCSCLGGHIKISARSFASEKYGFLRLCDIVFVMASLPILIELWILMDRWMDMGP